MRYDQIVRSKGAMAQHIQRVDEVKIPDVWHTLDVLRNQVEGREARPLNRDEVEAVYELWHLSHDLLNHIKRINGEEHRP